MIILQVFLSSRKRNLIVLGFWNGVKFNISKIFLKLPFLSTSLSFFSFRIMFLPFHFNVLSLTFKNISLQYSCFTMLCQFLFYSKVNQLNINIQSTFFGFPYHLGHHRSLSRVPCAIWQIPLVIYFMHSISCVYTSISIFQFIPLPLFPLVAIHFFPLHLCFYFCFVDMIIQTNFFHFQIYAFIYICFSPSDLFHSV